MSDLDKLLTGIGALAESLGLLRKELVRNGFSEEEAVTLCAELIAQIFHRDNE